MREHLREAMAAHLFLLSRAVPSPSGDTSARSPLTEQDVSLYRPECDLSHLLMCHRGGPEGRMEGDTEPWSQADVPPSQPTLAHSMHGMDREMSIEPPDLTGGSIEPPPARSSLLRTAHAFRWAWPTPHAAPTLI